MIAHCDRCGHVVYTAIDTASLDTDYDEVVCKSCRDNRDERAYECQQQAAMDGDHLERQIKEDQQLRDAGRGHLVRP